MSTHHLPTGLLPTESPLPIPLQLRGQGGVGEEHWERGAADEQEDVRTWGRCGCRKEPAGSQLGTQSHSWWGSSRRSLLEGSYSTCRRQRGLSLQPGWKMHTPLTLGDWHKAQVFPGLPHSPLKLPRIPSNYRNIYGNQGHGQGLQDSLSQTKEQSETKNHRVFSQ